MIFIFHLMLIINGMESTQGTGLSEVGHFAGQYENEIKAEKFKCPEQHHKLPFLGFKCRTNEDCILRGEICCREKKYKICRKGLKNLRKETLFDDAPYQAHHQHKSIACKQAGRPLFQIFPIQNCTHDSDCGLWRICCRDGEFSYCRRETSQFNFLFMSEIMKTVSHVMPYLQCTPPPPPLLDFFAKPCKNMLDCFPNLCCEESGRKVCRPSRRSIIPHLTALF